MPTLTVTAKGQITLRKELLRHLGAQPGDRLTLDLLPDGRLTLQAARPAGRIQDAFGLLRRRSQPRLSVADMNAIATEGWAGKR